MEQMTWAELKHENLDAHIALLNEEWNEPDDYEVGLSAVHRMGELQDGGAVVMTPTRMRFREVGAPVPMPYRVRHWDHAAMWSDWIDTLTVATYKFEDPNPLEVNCYNPSGSLGYSTRMKDD